MDGPAGGQAGVQEAGGGEGATGRGDEGTAGEFEDPEQEEHMTDLLSYLTENGRLWINQQRTAHYTSANPLPLPLRTAYSRFFLSETLELPRVAGVLRIENPPFYADLLKAGPSVPLDFTAMAGITLVDTILVSRERADVSELGLRSLLFHECVHVAQYQHLGLERFVHEYVSGWAKNGYQYEAIPLEQQAYELQHRFLSGDEFSVEECVVAQFPSLLAGG